jgi:UDP-N-acetylmuramate--alanine ligase
VEPIFVDEVSNLAAEVLQHARAGDVVICMGAGSIGAVPAQVLALAGAVKE